MGIELVRECAIQRQPRVPLDKTRHYSPGPKLHDILHFAARCFPAHDLCSLSLRLAARVIGRGLLDDPPGRASTFVSMTVLAQEHC